MIYYFAYGSNMSSRRLLARLAHIEKVGTFSLAQHQLAFHKKGDDGSAKADAFFTGNNTDQILGVAYRVSSKDIAILDQIEGVGAGYERKQVSIVNHLGESLDAVTYYATKIDHSLAPYNWYHHHVLLGALQAKLPTDYVAKIESVNAIQDPDKQRRKREANIYRPAPITIRQLQDGEEKQLWKIFFHTIRHVNLGDYSQAQVEAWAPDVYKAEEWSQRIQKISPFVATIDDFIVGYADIQSDGYIDHFYCHHAYQGIGVGKQLISQLFNTARANNTDRLYTHASITAKPFFEHYGFQLVKSQQVDTRGQTLTNFVMEKYC